MLIVGRFICKYELWMLIAFYYFYYFSIHFIIWYKVFKINIEKCVRLFLYSEDTFIYYSKYIYKNLIQTK